MRANEFGVHTAACGKPFNNYNHKQPKPDSNHKTQQTTQPTQVEVHRKQLNNK
jgi:hypothetical protein